MRANSAACDFQSTEGISCRGLFQVLLPRNLFRLGFNYCMTCRRGVIMLDSVDFNTLYVLTTTYSNRWNQSFHVSHYVLWRSLFATVCGQGLFPPGSLRIRTCALTFASFSSHNLTDIHKCWST